MHAKPKEDTPKESIRYTRGDSALAMGNRWEDDAGNVIWPAPRVFVVKHMEAQYFEMFMGFVIMLNMQLIIIEVDAEAQCYPVPEGQTLDDCETQAGKIQWLWFANTFLLSVYTIEAVARIYGERGAFFRSSWNILDFIIVVSGWSSELFRAVPSLGSLRFLRTLRLLRVLRIFISFRELYLLASGMASAFRTLFFSTFVLFALLTLWSIVLVEHVHPVNVGLMYEGCTRCPEAFKSVMASNLTLFQQIVTGDSWGQVSIPVIEARPFFAIIIVGIVVTVSLGLMNLVLAVIVERAQDAREKDKEAMVRQKEEEQEEQKMELFKFCKEMDADHSGELDLPELLDAYEAIPAFRALLTLMDIAEDELQSVFKLLDRDSSGTVSYMEFCEELHKIRTRDTRTMLTFLKLQVNECADQVKSSGAQIDKRFTTQDQKLDTMLDRLEKLGSLEAQRPAPASAPAPPSGTSAWAQQTSMPSMRTDVGPGQSLVDALGKDAREIASMKNGILARVEAQVETLLQQSDWLSSMSYATPAPDTAKIQRLEDKMCRLRENLYNTEKSLEGMAAALARNSEVLSGLSTEMGHQPKVAQRRPDRLMTVASPRIGAMPPQKEGKMAGDPGAPRNVSMMCGGFEKGQCVVVESNRK